MAEDLPTTSEQMGITHFKEAHRSRVRQTKLPESQRQMMMVRMRMWNTIMTKPSWEWGHKRVIFNMTMNPWSLEVNKSKIMFGSDDQKLEWVSVCVDECVGVVYLWL